jgi:antitoxin component YwqK of YwqJK toxin-antitoxin module
VTSPAVMLEPVRAYHGDYSFVDMNGYRYQGRYEHGLRVGKWNVSRPDGSPAWSQEWDRGVWHGVSEEWWPNGQMLVQGTYERGQQAGTWTYWFKSGQPATSGQYKGGRKVGIWSYWGEDGTGMSSNDWEREYETCWEITDFAVDDTRGFPHGENWPEPDELRLGRN